MKREFKVGQRVAFYYEKRYVGKIVGIHGEEFQIKTLDGSGYFNIVHPKQCRHLKKRERRRVWVNYKNGVPSEVTGDIDFSAPNWVQFIEVRKKK